MATKVFSTKSLNFSTNSSRMKRWTPRYDSSVSMEERENGVKDEFGVLFNKDLTKLLSAPKDLETYKVPNGVKVICYDAFFGSNIRSIELPLSLECIGWNAFYRCYNLAELILPYGLRSIEGEAFIGCSSLHRLHIPKNVSFIGPNPIAECMYINITCDSPNFVVENNVLYNRDKSKVIAYWGSEDEINLPNTVTEIGRSAFSHSSLKKIVFPYNLIRVRSNAFYYSRQLQEVVMNDTLQCIEGYTFCGCSQLSKIEFSHRLTSISTTTFCECSSLKEVVLPDEITNIGSDAFEKCSSLQKITLPKSLSGIGEKAFQSCTSLCEITIPANVVIIEDKAFRYCRQLREIRFERTYCEIGDRAFTGCDLSTIFVPKGSARLKAQFSHLASIIITES